ncbi:MAG: bifunctional tetrahydrofolate synthase/dihydrofolate synthase [Gammaproteobacteria bacterium]|nr:bifunctional tetrahydrofolate synthase/dihydrofolate synthase [Gammaproteobacteria bacterium]
MTINSPATLDQWLAYLEQLHSSAIDMGLARVSAVGDRLALAKPAPLVILVAGTNGKGTTCAALEQLLQAAGQRTAVYGSPHLLRYNERLRIDGRELGDADHCAAFACIEAARGDTSLTYFEFGTLAALQLIKAAAVDVAIIEVGLGGRLDATNIVDPDLSIITTVDLDHQAFLGNDRNSIGFEKAGILRAGRPAVIGEIDPPATVLARAAELSVDGRWFGRDFAVDAESELWTFVSGTERLAQLPRPAIPLVNAAVAIQALLLLGLLPPLVVLRQVLATLRLAGRLQPLGEAPLKLVDVAHNPHAARYLASELQRLAAGRRLLAVVGMMADKDLAGVFAALLPLVSQWWLVAPDLPRAASTAQLRAALPVGLEVQQAPSVAVGWQQALAAASATDVVIGFGSFYTVAEILQAEQDNCGH